MPTQEEPKLTYLGDGLYARHLGYYIAVFTFNGITEGPYIFFEPEVLNELNVFATKVWNQPHLADPHKNTKGPTNG